MAKVAEFQVSTRHTKIPTKLKVTIYDNLKDVRKWGKWDGGEAYGETTYGVCNKQAVYYDEEGGKLADKPTRLEAFIRLEKDHCPTGIVAHEVAHAAVYFFVNDGNRLHKDTPISVEEKFCYIYGNLFHEVTKKMYKKGIWS